MNTHSCEYPIFWLVDDETRASLLLYQAKNYDQRLDIPPSPSVSKAAWEITISENSEELRKLMEQPPLSEGRGY